MATFDLPEQMAALQAMRAELEAALANDENWRALRRGGASRSNTQDDRRDRDARLAKALEANPLYAAWTHIGAAIDALRGAEHAADAAEAGDGLTRLGGAAARATEAPWPDAEEEAGEIELPKDIRERIRADAADVADGDAIEPPTQPAQEAAEPVAPEVSQEARKGRASRKLVVIPSLEPIAAPAEQAFSDRLQKLEADMDELNEALEAPSRAVVEPVARADAVGQPAVEEPAASPVAASAVAKMPDVSNSDLPTVRLAEPVEAKVTFVRRQAPASALAKENPAAPSGKGFVPLTATPEEAEVAIVKPEEPNVAPVRRFLKALSGD